VKYEANIEEREREREKERKALCKDSAVSMQDINSSPTVLLTFGTLYLQQSFLAPVWLFLDEI